MKISTRIACAKRISELITQDRGLILVTADGNDYANVPRRQHVDVGIAEANQLNISLGLALRGLTVFTTGITSFSLENSFLQLKNIAFHSSKVILIGVGSGISYSKLGYSHHAPNDIALLSALPNIRIFLPADSYEAVAAIETAVKEDGPSFIRLRTGLEEIVYHNEPRISFQRPELIVDQGKENLIVTFGALVPQALQAIRASKTKVSLLNINSWNNYPIKKITEILLDYNNVFIFEEHYEDSGIASQILAECNHYHTMATRFFVRGLPKRYIDYTGSDEYFFKKFGLDANAMKKVINSK